MASTHAMHVVRGFLRMRRLIDESSEDVNCDQQPFTEISPSFAERLSRLTNSYSVFPIPLPRNKSVIVLVDRSKILFRYNRYLISPQRKLKIDLLLFRAIIVFEHPLFVEATISNQVNCNNMQTLSKFDHAANKLNGNTIMDYITG